MKRPEKGICVDASTRGNPGPSSVKCSFLSGEIIKEVDVGYSTNNITEFIALILGIYLAFEKNEDYVFSDSQTAMAWVRKKKTNSSLKKSPATNKVFDFLSRSEKLLKKYTIFSDDMDIEVAFEDKKVTVKKWHTHIWGEIPADFGYKH